MVSTPLYPALYRSALIRKLSAPHIPLHMLCSACLPDVTTEVSLRSVQEGKVQRRAAGPSCGSAWAYPGCAAAAPWYSCACCCHPAW